MRNYRRRCAPEKEAYYYLKLHSLHYEMVRRNFYYSSERAFKHKRVNAFFQRISRAVEVRAAREMQFTDVSKLSLGKVSHLL